MTCFEPGKAKTPFAFTALLFFVAYICFGFTEAHAQTQRQNMILTPRSSESSRTFLSNCEFKRNDSEQWSADCDYGLVYSKELDDGVPGSASYVVEFNWVRKDGEGRVLKDEEGHVKKYFNRIANAVSVIPGTGHISGYILPGIETLGVEWPAFTTTSITANLMLVRPRIRPKYSDQMQNRVVLASQEIDLVVNWPDRQTWVRGEEVRTKSASDVIGHAVQLIDTGGDTGVSEQIEGAKRLLEMLIAKDPKQAGAYVELARIALRIPGGAEGFYQAESLLKSSLEIQPGNSNAVILKGYVLTHQGRFVEAEKLFSSVNTVGLKNLWLWANWGEMLSLSGKKDAALVKYRKAIEHPPTSDTYDRARKDAYQELFRLLEARKDINGMEDLHKQRVEDYSGGTCFGAEYARFKLFRRGDVASAIALAEQSIQSGCPATLFAKNVIGYAHYTAWATSKAPDGMDSLNRARVYLPGGPRLLYGLAESEFTLVAATKLISMGERIDQMDNRKMTALAYALEDHSYDAVRSLIRLGAKAETLVGPQDIPVALIPVLSKDVEGIRVLRKLGIDYSRVRFQGMSALDIAKRIGDPKVTEAVQIAKPKV